jgi:hypothetical protein
MPLKQLAYMSSFSGKTAFYFENSAYEQQHQRSQRDEDSEDRTEHATHN